MASETMSESKKIPRGRVQFEIEGDGETLTVHVDRKGFRRLLATLERLAETGERQSFDKSGRSLPGNRNGAADGRGAVSKLVFHIDGEG